MKNLRMKNFNTLRECIEALLSVCDGANTKDGSGFNMYDSQIAHSLHYQDEWSLNQANMAYKMLKKYRKQLLGFGIDYDKIMKPADPDNVKKSNDIKGEELVEPEKTVVDWKILVKNIQWSEPKQVVTSYGDKVVRTSTIPDGFWDEWKNHKEEIKEAGYSVSKYNGEWQLAHWTDLKESKDIEVIKPQDIELKYSDLLLKYQIPHVKILISSILNFGGVMDGSDTGTGKTYTALSVAKELGLFPIVITRKSVVPIFRKVMEEHFGLKGFVSNYEQYKFGKTPYCKPINDQPSDNGFIWNVPENTLIIWDEVHSCKNYKTKNSKMLVQAKDQNIKNLVMSATVADNPIQMYSTGYAINLFNTKKGYFNWAKKVGVTFDFGAEFNNSRENLIKIHNQIYPNKGSRIAIKNLGDAFPDNKIISDAYYMNDNAKKIEKIYEEMERQLTELRKKSQNDNPDNPLTVMLRARQKIELLKVPTLVEMAKDLLEEGNSVAIFVNFNETVKSLAEKLDTDCIIWGNNKDTKKGGNEREINRMKFQNDESRIIICNIRAGGVGISLHDVNGKYSRVSLISPSWSAQDLKQALGRIHRAGAKSKAVQKLIFCAETIEEKIAKNVKQKIDRIDLLNDGELQ